MVLTQTHTYVFNCGEGMQRLCQFRGRIPRNSDVFLTRVCWDVAGGLPGNKPSKYQGLIEGYLLTASEIQDSRIQIHGPKNLAHFLATFRNYIFR